MTKFKLAAGMAVAATLATCGVAYAQQERKMGPSTRAEVQAMAAEHFAMMDANKDGKLDAADRAAHQAMMFDRLDTDKDGKVSREEFTAAHQARKDGMGGSGKERMGHRMGGEHGRGGMMMLGMADSNKDGTVTQAEFSAAALAHFDKIDGNKDGTLSQEERRAARKEMRQHMKGMRGAPPAGA